MAWLNNKWINILGIDKLGGRVRFRATEKHITIMWIRELRTYDGNNLCLAQYFHHFPTLIGRIRALSVILKLLKPRMKRKNNFSPVLVPHNGGLTITWLNQLFLFRQSTWRIFCLSWWCSWWRMVWRNKPSCFLTNQVLGTSFPRFSSDLTSKSMANCSSKIPAMVCYLCLYFLLKQRTQKKNRCQMKNQAREWSSQVECDFMNCKKKRPEKHWLDGIQTHAPRY